MTKEQWLESVKGKKIKLKDRLDKIVVPTGDVYTTLGGLWFKIKTEDGSRNGYVFTDSVIDNWEIVEEETVFEVGDEVEAFGTRGVIITYDFTKEFCIVKFDDNPEKMHCFTRKGKVSFDWFKEPALKLIKKAPKKIKEYQWLIKSQNEVIVSICHYSEEEAKERFGICLIRKIEETEIEVEI